MENQSSKTPTHGTGEFIGGDTREEGHNAYQRIIHDYQAGRTDNPPSLRQRGRNRNNRGIGLPQGPPQEIGHARGGIIDGGWYGQNSPSPLRFQDGGLNDPALWQPQPNPAYQGLAGIPSAIGQGVVDPILGTLQLGNALVGGPDQADTDERIRTLRENYKQSLPGGKETWMQWIPRVAASSLGLGAVMPEIEFGAGLAGKIGSGAARGPSTGPQRPRRRPTP